LSYNPTEPTSGADSFYNQGTACGIKSTNETKRKNESKHLTHFRNDEVLGRMQHRFAFRFWKEH